MIDREKVIKALECRKNADKRCGNPCEDTGMCHYATAVQSLDGEIYRPFICDRERICADAIALLKEQEAVKPGKDNDGTPEPYIAWWYVCGNCSWPIDMTDRYCRRCGRSVKWDD